MTSPELVDWALAERVAVRVARRQPVPTVGVDDAPPEADFARLTATAESLVAEQTGLVSLLGPARIEVVDRAEWIAANLRSFRRLLTPLLEGYAQQMPADRGGAIRAIGRQMAGGEIGILLGWMSSRVLGQYDLLVADDEGDADPGAVYVVGPNLVGLEQRFGFPPEQFRLWVALHELTHRAQFTGVPWMRPFFLGQVEAAMSLANPDPGALMTRLREAMFDRDDTRERLRQGGLPAVFASADQRVALDRLGGLMSLLEGHGDVTMDRAGKDLVPSAERFSRVLHARRRKTNLLQRLTGIAAKLEQYAAGERFIAAIETAGGLRAIDRCWTGPDALPTMDEIREPERWITRQLDTHHAV